MDNQVSVAFDGINIKICFSSFLSVFSFFAELSVFAVTALPCMTAAICAYFVYSDVHGDLDPDNLHKPRLKNGGQTRSVVMRTY